LLCRSILLQHEEVRKFLEVRDSGGNSALINAVFNNNVWLVRELLLAGASVLDKGSGVGAGGNLDSAYDTARWIYMVQYFDADSPSVLFMTICVSGRNWN
jgi:hypothetical protein